MLEVRDIEVISFDLNRSHLSWKLRVSGDDPLDYDFYVLRSESIGGPFDQIAGPLRMDTYEYIDNDVYHQPRTRTYYYRIKTVLRATGEEKIFPADSAAWIKARTPLDALEMQRQERLLFREHIGRRVILLPVRTFGRRCRCWDPVTKRSLVSRCLSCFDTTWIGGYLQPIEVWVQIDPSPQVFQNSTHGREVQDNTSARLGVFPPVKPGDVLVEADNTRWRIRQRSTTQRLRAVIRQEIQLHRIVEGSIEYEFPIHWPESLDASPAWVFTNPQSPELSEELSDLTAGAGGSIPFSGGVTVPRGESRYMLISVYDRNRNNIVDRAEQLEDPAGNIVTAEEARGHIDCTKVIYGYGNPNGTKTGCLGQTYVDLTYRHMYRCSDNPSGTRWELVT